MDALGWDAGRLAPGRLADLVTVGLGSVRLAGARPADAVDQLVFAATADVTSVVVSGRQVVRDGQHLLVGDVPAARPGDHRPRRPLSLGCGNPGACPLLAGLRSPPGDPAPGVRVTRPSTTWRRLSARGSDSSWTWGCRRRRCRRGGRRPARRWNGEERRCRSGPWPLGRR